MEIFLVRHGIAEDPSEVASDSARGLTKEGEEKTSRVARAFRKRISRVDIIFHSSYLRAEQTALLFAREFPEARLVRAAGLTPHDPAKGALALFQKSGSEQALMVVGHEPYLSSLASLLLTGREEPILEFKKAGIAAFECHGELRSCSLQFLLTPRWLS